MKAGKKSDAEAQRGGEAERTDRWPLVRLGEVCDGSVARIRTIVAEAIDYIDISSIDRKTKSIVATTRHNTKQAPGRAQQVVRKGDVLVSTVRPNLNAVALINNDGGAIPLIASTGFCVLRPKDELLSEYLHLYCQTDSFVEPLVSVSEKASYPSVTDSIVKDVLIPLPPLATQRAIVARLDSALARAGALEKRFAAIAQNAELSFKASLNEEFAGRTGGTGETGGTGGSSDSRSSSTSRNPSDPSKPWPLVRLGDVCETISSRGHQIPQSAIRAKGHWPVVSQSEAIIEGYTDEATPINEVPLVLFGDHTCCVKLVKEPFVVGADGTKLLHSSVSDAGYIYYFCRDAASRLADGRYRRHFSDLMALAIPLPPLPVQRAIVTRLDAARKRADGIAALARQAAEAAANLKKALLKEAFE